MQICDNLSGAARQHPPSLLSLRDISPDRGNRPLKGELFLLFEFPLLDLAGHFVEALVAVVAGLADAAVGEGFSDGAAGFLAVGAVGELAVTKVGGRTPGRRTAAAPCGPAPSARYRMRRSPAYRRQRYRARGRRARCGAWYGGRGRAFPTPRRPAAAAPGSRS